MGEGCVECWSKCLSKSIGIIVFHVDFFDSQFSILHMFLNILLSYSYIFTLYLELSTIIEAQSIVIITINNRTVYITTLVTKLLEETDSLEEFFSC